MRRRRRVLGACTSCAATPRARRTCRRVRRTRWGVGRTGGRITRTGRRHARCVRTTHMRGPNHRARRRIARARWRVGRRGSFSKDAWRGRRVRRRRSTSSTDPWTHGTHCRTCSVVRWTGRYIARGGRHIAITRTLCTQRRTHRTLSRAQVVAVASFITAHLNQGREHCLLLHSEVIDIGRARIIRRHTTRCTAAHVIGVHTELGSPQVCIRLVAVDNDILECVHVEIQVKGTCAHRRHLAKQDILANTLAIVHVTHRGGFH